MKDGTVLIQDRIFLIILTVYIVINIMRKGNGLMPWTLNKMNKTYGLCTCPRMTKSRYVSEL